MKFRINVVAVASVLTLLLATSSQATLVLVNDFESGASGVNSNGNVSIVTDPDDVANKALEATGGVAFDALVGGFTIPTDSLGTVFVRVRLTDASGSNPGVQGGFGVSDKDWTAAQASSQDKFNARTHVESTRTFDPPGRRTQTGVYDGFLLPGGADSLQGSAPDAWQNIWFVLDTTADRFDMYVEGGGFATQTQVADDYKWYRDQGNGDDMIGFYIYGGSGSKATYIDDIYVDTSGQNLSNPTVASVPEASLLSLWVVGSLLMLGKRKRNQL